MKPKQKKRGKVFMKQVNTFSFHQPQPKYFTATSEVDGLDYLK